MYFIGSIHFTSIMNDDIVKRIKAREHTIHPTFKLDKETTTITLTRVQFQTNTKCLFLVNNADQLEVNGLYAPSEGFKIYQLVCKTPGVVVNLTYEYGDYKLRPQETNFSMGENCNCQDGATFIPSVDSSGNISWSNNKNLKNPQTINIKGQQGDVGATGPRGETGPQGPPGEASSSQNSMYEELYSGWTKGDIDLGVNILDYSYIELYTSVSDNVSPRGYHKFIAEENVQNQLSTAYFHSGSCRFNIAIKSVRFEGTKIVVYPGWSYLLNVSSTNPVYINGNDAIAIIRVVGIK